MLEFHQLNRVAVTVPEGTSYQSRVADYNRRLGISPTPECMFHCSVMNAVLAGLFPCTPRELVIPRHGGDGGLEEGAGAALVDDQIGDEVCGERSEQSGQLRDA